MNAEQQPINIQVVQPDIAPTIQRHADRWLPPLGQEAQWFWGRVLAFPSNWWDLARCSGLRFAIPSFVVALLYHLPVPWQMWGLSCVAVAVVLALGLSWYFRPALPRLLPLHWALLGFGCAVAIKTLTLLS
ncbi:hypothetical protein IQ249_24700 [Lusitaniella coriacea LEGE 07157]|uniref:Uncharacterized protein n=1 Tax=Lusitaniella coriacea LEGE 07157 TaxID=945747 RepID=A0A8J7E0Y1_9CYAN|nr:hypothetical protein [Lusitaniella coriacea]MBE9119060.1 hypothetical protein [Lusitaniella coriacea LEGE 07157]